MRTLSEELIFDFVRSKRTARKRRKAGEYDSSMFYEGCASGLKTAYKEIKYRQNMRMSVEEFMYGGMS